MSQDAGEAERSWETVARKRKVVEQLKKEISEETPQAIKDARNAGVSMQELAEMWGVTQAWIYTIVPARRGRGS